MPLFESSFLPFIWVVLFFSIFCPSPLGLPLVLSGSSFYGFSSWTEISEVFFTVQTSTWTTPSLIRLFFCRLFIMNGYFWGFSYYSGLSFYIECDNVRQATYIDAKAVMESPRTFRRLPWRSLTFLQLILVAQIYLRGDLSVLPEWMLGLTEDLRFCID